MADHYRMLKGVLLKVDEFSSGGMLDPTDFMDTTTRAWWSQEKHKVREALEKEDKRKATESQVRSILSRMGKKERDVLFDQGYLTKKGVGRPTKTEAKVESG